MDSSALYYMYKLVWGVAECRWYLVSVFIKYRLPPIFYILAFDKCRKESL